MEKKQPIAIFVAPEQQLAKLKPGKYLYHGVQLVEVVEAEENYETKILQSAGMYISEDDPAKIQFEDTVNLFDQNPMPLIESFYKIFPLFQKDSKKEIETTVQPKK